MQKHFKTQNTKNQVILENVEVKRRGWNQSTEKESHMWSNYGKQAIRGFFYLYLGECSETVSFLKSVAKSEPRKWYDF